jgi:phosphate transport system permease protein
MSDPRTSPVRLAGTKRHIGDRVLFGSTRAAGYAVLALTLAIFVFLVVKSIPALQANTANFFTEKNWFPDSTPAVFGILALAWGTILSSLLAMCMATPVAIGIALFIAHYAPRRLAGVLGYIIDLLAAVPSVVYGLWGVMVLVPKMVPVQDFLNKYFGWIPLFGGQVSGGRTIFTASVILAIMILPIIAAVSREVFLQAPRDHIEAAAALGATRWETMRYAVLPYGRSGVVSAAMLGLGRALGETIAVALVLSTSYTVSIHVLVPGGNTFAANIANRFGEAGPIGVGALIASGLVLFLITFFVNLAARTIVARRGNLGGAGA